VFQRSYLQRTVLAVGRNRPERDAVVVVVAFNYEKPYHCFAYEQDGLTGT